MRKILSLFMVFVLALSMAACVHKKIDPTIDSATISEKKVKDYVYEDVYITQTDHNNPAKMGIFYRNTIGADISSKSEAEQESDRLAEAKLKSIEEFPDTLTAKEGGKVYYLSNEGNDTNDGLTPETARKNFFAVKTILKAGKYYYSQIATQSIQCGKSAIVPIIVSNIPSAINSTWEALS